MTFSTCYTMTFFRVFRHDFFFVFCLRIFLGAFFPFISEWQWIDRKGGREMGDDTQQRAAGLARTRAAAKAPAQRGRPNFFITFFNILYYEFFSMLYWVFQHAILWFLLTYDTILWGFFSWFFRHTLLWPVALTSVAMKSFERLVLTHLKIITGHQLDPLQFAYRAKRSVDDAMNDTPNLHISAYQRTILTMQIIKSIPN